MGGNHLKGHWKLWIRKIIKMRMTNKIPLTEKDIKKYLDECIVFWSRCHQEGDKRAAMKLEAFQDVRYSLIGEELSFPEPEWRRREDK
jgi:hypothetical protein